MLHVALTQQLVLQHRTKRRRERHSELERHAVIHQPLHHAQQRDIGLGDRFEKPIFLQKTLVLRMPNERKMGVENEGKKASHCETFTLSFRAERGISHWLLDHADYLE